MGTPHPLGEKEPKSGDTNRRELREAPAVTRTNALYLVIGALAVAVAVLGYQLYQDRHPPQGVHIDVGPGGLSIQGK